MTNLGESSNFISEATPCEEIGDPGVLAKNPLVSVKMLTYNHEAYIAQAMEGVLQQKTNFPFELVIGEDCSTDGTREIVFEYQKKYPDIIRVITSEQNVGAKTNSYRTEKACRGKYIAYCEGDDYWHRPDKLQKQVDYMETHPECGLICSDFDHYNVVKRTRKENYNRYRNMGLPENPDIYGIIQSKYHIITCTVLARKDLMDEIVESDPYLYQSGVFPMGDQPRWAEMSLRSRIGYIDESLATYDQLPESLSRSRNPLMTWRFAMSATQWRLYLCDKHHLSREVRDRCVERWCRAALMLAFYKRDSHLADEARGRKRRVTVVDRALYWGSRNVVLNYAFRILNRPRRLVIDSFQHRPL